MNILSSNRKTPKPPPFMRWGIMAFILVAAINGWRAEQDPETSRIKQYPELREFITLEHWHKHLNPELGKELEVAELIVGEGDYAACGQSVTVKVSYLLAEEQPLPVSFTLPETIHYTIGDGTQHPLFDHAVRGMRQGGVREVLAGPKWILPNSSPSEPPYSFELTLTSLSPYLANDAEYEARFIETGSGLPALCGDSVQVLVAGEKHLIHLGQNTLGHGIDRALIGMRIGARKRVDIPPAYAQNGKTQLVEVTRLPYVEPENQPEIHTDDPDR